MQWNRTERDATAPMFIPAGSWLGRHTIGSTPVVVLVKQLPAHKKHWRLWYVSGENWTAQKFFRTLDDAFDYADNKLADDVGEDWY